jgi:ATP-dependent Clp protease, protease subunit
MPTTTNPRNWYRFENVASDPTTVDIHIIDIIGGWMDEMMNALFGEKITLTAKAFVDQLAALPATVKALRVHINSPGGDVQGGVNIANALRDQRVSKGRTVETIIDGLAASSASIIAMAGSVVRMADNALVMIHNPYGAMVGNATEMRKMGDWLDSIRGQIVATYQWHSKMSADEIAALMDAETWMSADEAIANGFATEKIAGLQAAASISPRGLATMHVPEQFKARVDALLDKPAPKPEQPKAAAAVDVLRLCREGECLDAAEALVTAGATLDQATARIETVRTTRAQAAARATEIDALCQGVKLPGLAAGYIEGGMSVSDIRTHLAVVTAEVDRRVTIDGSLLPGQKTGKATSKIDVAATYAARNRAATQKE